MFKFYPARQWSPHWSLLIGLPRCYLFIRPSKDFKPLFSERYGLRRALYFAGLRVELMRPRPWADE